MDNSRAPNHGIPVLDVSEYIKFLVALVAIVDIPGSIPMFLGQTEGMSRRGRIIAALSAAVATALVLMVFAVFGESVLSAFGITLPAFKILGGLVILLIALDMLGLISSSGGHGSERTSGHPVAIGIFPMAVPLFAGPGAIGTIMIYSHRDFHSSHDFIIGMLILSISGLIAVGLVFVSLIGRFIPPIMQTILNRLLGMIVGALGVEFILEGIAGFYLPLTAL